MKMKCTILKQITAMVLCITLLSSQVVVAGEEGFNGDEITDSFDDSISDTGDEIPEYGKDDSLEKSDGFDNSGDREFSDSEETIINPDEISDDPAQTGNGYYIDGKICIYNYSQLLMIGTGAVVYTGDKDGSIGEGEPVFTEETELTYAANATYCLMNDILMDTENIWDVPAGFSGTITSAAENAGTTVYDAETDTIHVYNRYQLALMKEDSGNEPVMSEDYIAEKVGMGQVFTLEDGSYLTYSKTHNYVLASSFTTETPELLANKAGTEETTQDITSAYPSDYEGRNYFGQVVKKIGDKNYILIGNETQLRAIGTDVEVTEPIWRVYETREKKGGILSGYTDWKPAADTSEYKTELYYPGDADIVKFNDTYNWSGKKLYANKNGAHKLNDTEYLDNPSWDITGTKATQLLCVCK